MALSRICAIVGCPKPAAARGWCDVHYYRWRAHGHPLGGGPPRRPSVGPCVVRGCDKPAYAHGWCHAHYWRWKRHGDPLAGRTIQGAPAAYIDSVVLSHDGDECLIWPFGKGSHGYAVMGQSRVSRIVCEKVNGPPPSPELDAAHSCGVRACVNPAHLRWATRAENERDKLAHGTRVRGSQVHGSRLTESDVREIRRLRLRMPQRAVADLFGVDPSTVSYIESRKSWSWLQD